MMFTSNSNSYCLFCKTNVTILTTTSSYVDNGRVTFSLVNGSGEEMEVKREIEDFIVPRTHEDFHLEEQLKAVFVLRKILDFSEGRCAEYLRKNDGNHNCSEWFKICDICNGVVKDCYHVYREMLRCRRRLEVKKSLLKSKLEETTGKKWEDAGNQDLDRLFIDCQKKDLMLSPHVGTTESPTRRSSRIRRQKSYAEHDLNENFVDGGNNDVFQPPSQKCLYGNAEGSLTSSKKSGSLSSDDDDWRPDSPHENDDDEGPTRLPGETSKYAIKDQPGSMDESDPDQGISPIGKMEYRCKQCVAVYDNPRKFRLHVKLHEMPPVSRGSCGKCGWVILKSTSTRNHKKYCLAPYSKYKCELCPAEYSLKTKFEKHRSLHQSGEDAKTCFKCGWLISSKSYRPHIKNHYTKDYKPQRLAKNKNRKFSSRKSIGMMEALQTVPTVDDEIPYYCDHCHFIFTNKSALVQHVATSHRNDNVAFLDCEICRSTKFESKQLLQIHCKEVHGTVPETGLQCRDTASGSSNSVPVSCSYCVETFTTEMKRDYHIAKHHSAEFLRCPICKIYTTTQFNILRVHMKSHDPYHTTVCQFCAKIIRKGSLLTHNRIFHCVELGWTPIQCEVCKKIFISEKLRKRHMDVEHNNILPSCCPYCSKKFKRRRCLQKHIKSHSESKEKKCKKDSIICQISKEKFNVPQAFDDPMKRVECEKGSENTHMDHQSYPQVIALPSQLDSAESPVRRSSRIRKHRRPTAENGSGPESLYQDDDDDDDHTNADDILTSPKKCESMCSDDDWRPPDSSLESDDGGEEPTFSTGERNQYVYNKDLPMDESNSVSVEKMESSESGPLLLKLKKSDSSSDSSPGDNLTLDASGQSILSGSNEAKGYRSKFTLTRKYHQKLKHKRVLVAKSRYKRKRRTLQKREKKSHSREANKKDEDEIPYYCDHCHFIFTSKFSLIHHVSRKHKKDNVAVLECEICPSTKFESKQLLRMHCAVVHGTGTGEANGAQSEDSQSVSCSYCSETFATSMKRDYHIAKYHRDKFLTCPICKTYSATQLNILRKHMMRHESHERTMCEFCSKMIRSNSIATHNRLFHYAELGLKRIQCEECKKVFSRETSLKQHMDFVHNHNAASSCPFCLKQFKWEKDLEKHIKSHNEPVKHEYKKGPFFCQICQAKFNVRQGLYYHMKRLHSDKYSFRCDKCGKGYCFENALLDHAKACNAQNDGKSLK